MAWLLAAGAMACGDTAGPTAAVTGVVIDLSGDALNDIDSLILQDESGATWEFVLKGQGGATASHLREHIVLGLPITVSFHEKGDELVVDRLEDYTPGETPEPQP